MTNGRPNSCRCLRTDMGGEYQLRGSELSLLFDGPWVRCSTCKSVHRPVPGLLHCLDCGSEEIAALNPENDPVFLARKGYYRRPVMAALAEPAARTHGASSRRNTPRSSTPRRTKMCFRKRKRTSCCFRMSHPHWAARLAARPQSMFFPARRRWRSALILAHCPAWRCAICRRDAQIINNVQAALAAAATPLRPWSHSAARTVTTSIILPNLTE